MIRDLQNENHNHPHFPHSPPSKVKGVRMVVISLQNIAKNMNEFEKNPAKVSRDDFFFPEKKFSTSLFFSMSTPTYPHLIRLAHKSKYYFYPLKREKMEQKYFRLATLEPFCFCFFFK